jgi:hypothetical protein
MKFLVTPDMRVYNMGQTQLPLCLKPYYSIPCEDTNGFDTEVLFAWDEDYYFKTHKYYKDLSEHIENNGPCGWILSYDGDVLVELESTEQGEIIIREILTFLPSSNFTVIYINKDLTVSAI